LYGGASHFVRWRLTFCTVAPHMLYGGASHFQTITAGFFSFSTKKKFTCCEQKAPNKSEVHRSLQNCGSLEWN